MFILKSIIIIWLALTTTLSAGEIELSEKLWQSYHNHQRIPLISASQANLSIEQAYLVQTHYVKKRLSDGKPAGFKAGLTNEAVQKKFKVNQALAGVLFADGDLSRANSIQLSQFKRLMLETEIGFEVGTAITSLLKNPDELKRHIRAVFPVIELPDLGFANKPKGIDIIAANVGAAAFIKGKAITTEIDLNALTVTLTKNGKIVNTGEGRDALGNQWKTALWLVNTLIENGWALEAGQFFITGALGQMIPCQVGNYQAEFGKLGHISFSAVP